MARLFFSYSHKDEDLRDQLEVHLATLKHQKIIESFHDRRIMAGADLGNEIDAALNEADIILALVSPDFIASNYCYSIEMARALERHRAGQASLIPVILRHCDWPNTPLAELRGTPRDNIPVMAWPDRDEALSDVARDIRRVAEEIARTEPPAPTRTTSNTSSSTPEGEVVSKPRSANLHIPKRFTDLDRAQFVKNAFEFVAELFANSLDELHRRHPDIYGEVDRRTSDILVATAFRDGKRRSAMTVFIGHTVYRDGISFNRSDAGEKGSMNASYAPVEDVDRLVFKNQFGAMRGDNTLYLDQAGLAEEIWAEFISSLQSR